VHGMFTIYWKEMQDHFGSVRFLLIAAVIVMVGVIIASMVGMSMQEELRGVAKPDFVFLLLFTSTGSFFRSPSSSVSGAAHRDHPRFDAINRERSAGP